jgi:phospholipid-binding lipoprotein MlaA
MPSSALNKLLQGDLEDAVHNTVRFALNSTLGLGGLFDPATAIGLDPRKSDFGATLHVWGVPEGTYAELPFIGPSTSRDTLGMMVDFVIDPLAWILPSGTAEWALVAKYGSKLGDRARFSATVDSILHESADSYSQTRLMYLQNRRFELGQEVADDDFIDPYE